MKKILLIAIVAVFAISLMACSSPQQVPANEDLAAVLEQAKSDIEEQMNEVQENLDSTVIDPDTGDVTTDTPAEPAPSQDGEEADVHTDLYYVRYVGTENLNEVFGLCKVVWVNPDDTDLIEQYGLQNAPFDDDYELVVPDETFKEYYAFPEETLFRTIDYETDLSTKDLTCKEFIDMLGTEDDGTILAECTIMGDYIFTIEQVYVP